MPPQNLPVRAKVFTTAKDTDLRLTHTNSARFSIDGSITEAGVGIYVNPAKQFQTLLGIGGSITDASAGFCQLSLETKEL